MRAVREGTLQVAPRAALLAPLVNMLPQMARRNASTARLARYTIFRHHKLLLKYSLTCVHLLQIALGWKEGDYWTSRLMSKLFLS
jgi:hypothetical protein